MQGAWKVGLLVVVFVGLLLGAYALLKRSFFAPNTYDLYADFVNAGGVTPGTSVQMAGVNIGTVDTVSLMSDPSHSPPRFARVDMNIYEGVEIPAGSEAYLPTALIGLASNPIQIIPGSSGGALTAKAVISGRLGSPLDNMLPNAQDTLKELNLTLVATRKLLEDRELKGDVRKLLQTSEKTVASFQGLAGKFGSIADKVNGMMAQNQPVLNQAMRDAAAAMRDVQKSTTLVANMLDDPQWKEKTLGLMDGLQATNLRAQELVTSLTNFVNDPNLRKPLEQTLQNTATITDTGTRIAENTEEMTKNGVVITQKAIELADQAKEIAGEAKTLLQKLQGVLGKTPSTGMLGSMTGRMDLFRETDPGHYRTDVELIVPFRDTKIHAGLFDAFESNKVTLQLGKNFGSGGEIRYGIYASKPGIGVDYLLAPRLFVRGDVFDLNKPRFDLRARYDFGNGLFGWIGMNEIFKKNAPLIGIGIQK